MAYKYSTSGSRKLYIPFHLLALVFSITIIFFILRGTLSSIFYVTPLVLIIVSIAGSEIHRAYDTYEVNHRSVVHRRGFYHTHTRRIDLYAISDVIVTQSFYQKVLNFGNVQVRLFSTESKSTLNNLDKPHWFAEMVESNMHEARGNMQNNNKNIKHLKGEHQTLDEEILEEELEIHEKTPKHPSKHPPKNQSQAKKSSKNQAKTNKETEETDDEIIERLEEI